MFVDMSATAFDDVATLSLIVDLASRRRRPLQLLSQYRRSCRLCRALSCVSSALLDALRRNLCAQLTHLCPQRRTLSHGHLLGFRNLAVCHRQADEHAT